MEHDELNEWRAKFANTANNVASSTDWPIIQDAAERSWGQIGFIPGSIHRDSSDLELSNHAVIIRELQELDLEDSWDVMRFNHWAVGWVEEIAINIENPDLVSLGANITERLDDYSSLDEDDYIERRWEERLKDRYEILVLEDGETFTNLEGCQLIGFSSMIDETDIEEMFNAGMFTVVHEWETDEGFDVDDFGSILSTDGRQLYVVLNDDETISPLTGCQIMAITPDGEDDPESIGEAFDWNMLTHIHTWTAPSMDAPVIQQSMGF